MDAEEDQNAKDYLHSIYTKECNRLTSYLTLGLIFGTKIYGSRQDGRTVITATELKWLCMGENAGLN
jgi:hypothetical protein